MDIDLNAKNIRPYGQVRLKLRQKLLEDKTMKQIIPAVAYDELPCSVVAVGCALGRTDRKEIMALKSPGLHSDGYLSLDGMNALIRANVEVKKTAYFRRGERPTLREFAERNAGQKAVICLLGHFIYFDGKDYYSFFRNENDKVVKVWFLA